MEFIPLQIATIVPNKKIPFDLYIHFKGQYLAYAEAGTAIPSAKLTKLALQQIARFYLLREHEANYQAFLEDILNDAIKNSQIQTETKVQLTEGAAATGIEAMQSEKASPAAYNITQKAAKSLREVIEQNPNTLKKIYGKHSDAMTDVIRHSLNVCALCTKLGRKQGLENALLDPLGTAALLHDIGLTKLSQQDKALFLKPKKHFTLDDHRIYKMHVTDAVAMLANKPYVTPDIIEMVRHHEENHAGTGPLKVKKLTLSECILSLCNNYDKRVLTQKIHARQALKELQIEEMGNYDLKLLQAFTSVLHDEGLLE
ncbi:MAG: HD domain-containing protein [Bdellovibrio sp.]|nr:HD domain-containing protein [Bdellovibrio sp.]